MEKFIPTQSIARRLHLTTLAVSIFFLMGAIGPFISSQKSLNSMAKINHSNQISDLLRQLRLVLLSSSEVLQRSAAMPMANPHDLPVFQTAIERKNEILDKITILIADHPLISKPFNNLREALSGYQLTAEKILSDRTSLKQNLIINKEFENETLDLLTKIQLQLNAYNESTFNEIYSNRFTPLIASLGAALIFMSFSLLMGLNLSRRINSSIRGLTTATQLVTSGDLTFRAPIIHADELGLLTHIFNQMTQALQESTFSKQYVENIIQSMNDCLIVTDTNGQIQQINPVATKVLGYEEKELLGLSYKAIFSESFVFDKAMHRFETTCLAKSGTHIHVAVSGAALLTSAGDQQGFVYIVEDITERKKGQELLNERNLALAAANKELEAFSYSVSHDLRSPLRGIDGFSQALIEDLGPQLSAENKDYLQRIRTGVQRMGNLIDDILDLSKLSRKEMVFTDVNLSSVAERIIKELKDSGPARQVEVVIEPLMHAKADTALMGVLLENLLGNSWKYSSKKQSAKIEFGILKDHEKKPFFVRDNGAGFDMAYSQKLFGAFQRLHRDTDFPGTGVGLATVQRVVHRHGGTIWAEGKVGEGATFYFTLSC